MSLPWIKLHTALVDNTTFRRFSSDAKLTFLVSLMLAGKENRGGRLETDSGPITVKEFASATRLTPKRQDLALKELVTGLFITKDLTSTYIVQRFEEKTADLSTLRTRRHRERRTFQERFRDVPETFPQRSGNSPERRKEREELSASLRSAAIGNVPGTRLTRQVAGLKTLALLFIAAFANTQDPQKIESQVAYYVDALRIMAGKGATIEQAWSAFERCRSIDEKPMWGPKAKRALAHLDLDERPSGASAKSEPRDIVALAKRNIEYEKGTAS